MSARALTNAFAALALCVGCSWLAGIFFMTLALHQPTSAAPWTIFHYMRHYASMPNVGRLMSLCWLLSGSICAALATAILRRRKIAPYGNARWANEREVRQAKLRSNGGLLLGRFNEEFLISGGFEHALCFAPTRSGKGVGIVIPNLLNWPGSAIVHDIKGENFEKTAGFRARHGQKVYFWNPGDPEGRTHCYNPLEFISNKPGRRIDDIQKIAHLILPEQEFWTQEARTLFVGLCLHLIEKGSLSFGGVLRALRGQGNFVEDVKLLLQANRETMNPVAYMALNAFAQKADKEQSAVLSTLNAALELWANPLIDAATSRSDFDLRTLRQEAATIYVGVSPNNLHRLRPLMQVFYQQAIDIMTERQPDPVCDKHPVLFLMDEFPSLGRMTQFEQGIAYLAGYQVRLVLIIQDIPQLEASYGRSGMNIFMGNSKLRIAFASNSIETAELLSRFVGTFGAGVESNSRSQQLGLSLEPGHRSTSESQVARPLLLPQEILQLSPDEEIVLVEGAPPVRARKIRYFKEPIFQSRIHPAPPVPKVMPVTPSVEGLCDLEPRSEAEEDQLLNEEPEEEEISASH